jgi:hypothetical protein
LSFFNYRKETTEKYITSLSSQKTWTFLLPVTALSSFFSSLTWLVWNLRWIRLDLRWIWRHCALDL